MTEHEEFIIARNLQPNDCIRIKGEGKAGEIKRLMISLLASEEQLFHLEIDLDNNTKILKFKEEENNQMLEQWAENIRIYLEGTHRNSDSGFPTFHFQLVQHNDNNLILFGCIDQSSTVICEGHTAAIENANILRISGDVKVTSLAFEFSQ